MMATGTTERSDEDPSLDQPSLHPLHHPQRIEAAWSVKLFKTLLYRGPLHNPSFCDPFRTHRLSPCHAPADLQRCA